MPVAGVSSVAGDPIAFCKSVVNLSVLAVIRFLSSSTSTFRSLATMLIASERLPVKDSAAFSRASNDPTVSCSPAMLPIRVSNLLVVKLSTASCSPS